MRMRFLSVRVVVLVLGVMYMGPAYSQESQCEYKTDVPKQEISAIKRLYPGAVWDEKKNTFNIDLKNGGHIKIVYMACENVGVLLSMVIANTENSQRKFDKNMLALSKIIFKYDYPIISEHMHSDEYNGMFQDGRKVQSNAWFIDGEHYNLTITLDDLDSNVELEIYAS